MFSVFTDVVVPVIIIVGLGAIVGRWRDVQAPSLSALVFYLFSPALVFHSLSTTELPAALGVKIVSVIASGWVATLLMAFAWSKLRGHDPAMRAGFVLTMTSGNSGNMGLPVATLAFGAAGLDIAVVNFVASTLLTNSIGVAIASSADPSDHRSSLTAPLRYPHVYAAVLGLAVNAAGVDVPVAIASPLQTLGAATIPVMLVVLGLQLRATDGRPAITDLAAVTLGRLAVTPIVAYGASTALGLSGTERGTMTIVAAMPVAVMTTIIAAEFKARVDYVRQAVVVTTLASILTLTVVIALVR